MTNAEITKLQEVINAMTTEEAMVVANTLPIEILYDAFSNKIAALHDFVKQFKGFAENQTIFKEV